MLFVLNRDFQIIGLASNDSEDTLHYYDDILHTELASGVSTYEFTVPKNHEDSQFVQEGNYITFKNSKGKQLLFTIMEMEENGNEKVVYCEDIGLDLLNETVAPVASETAQPITFYLNHAIDDSGWEIGINEIAHLNRTLSFDSYTNALERVLSILNAFDDAEVEFTVEFDGNTVVHQYLNIHKRVGRDTGIRLDAGFDLVEARRTVSMEGLVTALRGVGSNVKNDNPDLPDTITDFSSIVYDDGRYYSELGDTFVRDREANLKWSRFRNGQAQWEGYIVDTYEYDTDSPQELFNRSLSQLQKRNEPAITYEIEINKIDVDLSIGDTVTIVDSDFKPALYLQARVLSVDESQTDDSKNSIKLGNYVLLTSSIDTQLKELQATLKEVRLSWFEQNQPVLDIASTNGEAFFNNIVSTTINATITRGGINTNGAYTDANFVWTKKDRLGNTVGGWSRTGKSLAITATDIVDKSTFICTVGGMVKQITLFNTDTTIKSTTAPASPQQGQLWLDTSVTPNAQKIYLSGAWSLVTPVSKAELDAKSSKAEAQGYAGTAETNAKQYADGVAKALVVGGRNFILKDTLNSYSTIVSFDKTNYVTNGAINISSTGNTSGFYFTYAGVKPNTKYVLHYNLQKLSGTLSGIGGHMDTTYGTNDFFVDGVDTGYGHATTKTLANDTTVHSIDVYFTTPATVTPADKIYIQPNRNIATAVEVAITNLKLEEGSKPTSWTPAIEDTSAIVMDIGGRLTNAESAITPDAITNTVMGTTTFTAKLSEYAKAEELSNYATNGDLSGVGSIAQSAKDAIDNLDLTPYVKTTQVEQLEDSINSKISQSGGVNLLRNSIGWNGTDFWVPTSGAYTVQTIQNPELESMGFGAGWYSPVGVYTHHRQELTLPALGTYTLNFYMKKSAYNASYTFKHAGVDVVVDGVITLVGLDGVAQATTLTNGFELFTYTFEAKTSKNIMVRLSITDSSETTISGLMLNIGSQPLQWSSNSTEVYNTNVRMDINGIQVLGNRDGSKTVITPDEFSGYEDGEKIFTLNGKTTEVKQLKAEKQFEMAPITIVTIDNASYKGWAFI